MFLTGLARICKRTVYTHIHTYIHITNAALCAFGWKKKYTVETESARTFWKMCAKFKLYFFGVRRETKRYTGTTGKMTKRRYPKHSYGIRERHVIYTFLDGSAETILTRIRILVEDAAVVTVELLGGNLRVCSVYGGMFFFETVRSRT